MWAMHFHPLWVKNVVKAGQNSRRTVAKSKPGLALASNHTQAHQKKMILFFSTFLTPWFVNCTSSPWGFGFEFPWNLTTIERSYYCQVSGLAKVQSIVTVPAVGGKVLKTLWTSCRLLEGGGKMTCATLSVHFIIIIIIICDIFIQNPT